MTDLAPSGDATRSCPNCAAQNDVSATTCDRCGAALPQLDGRDEERGDLETVEVARGVAADGFDTEFSVMDDGSLRCPVCGTTFTTDDAEVDSAQEARDTLTATDADVVVACTCPSCGTAGHAVLLEP